MYSPVSGLFLPAVRNPPAIVSRVEVWRNGARVDTYGSAGIPIYAGEVQVDGTKATRRTLTGLQVDATDEMWDLLSPVGTRLHAYRGFRYGPGVSELVPLGRFVVTSLAEDYGGDWEGQVDTAADLMSLVERATFTAPRTFPARTLVVDMISTLLGEVLGSVQVTATSQAVLPSTTVLEFDRLGEIQKAAESIGAVVYTDVQGGPVIADAPVLQNTAVWDIDVDPDSGILYQASRSRSTDQAYSAVVAVPTGIDGAATFSPQVAYDNDPNSPTYYLGPLGVAPYRLESDKWTSATQALAAAQAMLPLVTANRAEFDLTAECNPALDAWDTVNVHLPRRFRGQETVVERHMIGSLTVPLTPDGVQRITTRSSVADLPASA